MKILTTKSKRFRGTDMRNPQQPEKEEMEKYI